MIVVAVVVIMTKAVVLFGSSDLHYSAGGA